MIRKTYGYCRVSSGKQLDGNGMSRQQKMLLKYIQNYKDTKNLGYQLSIDDFSWILQPGQSAFKGYNLEEGALAEFIKEAIAGKHKNSCLLIENIDRFSRATPAKSALNFLAVTNAGVHVHEVETGEVFTDILNLELLASSITRANRESVRKQNLSNDNWEERYEAAKKGTAVLTKRVPKWIEVVDNHYQLTSESYIINFIFDKFCEGIGSTTIARELNTKRMLIGNAEWYPQNVNRLLSDKRVTGWLISTNKNRQDVRLYPQVITDEQFSRVQNIKNSSQPLVKHKPTENMNNLFNGISSCGLCGAAVGVIKQTYKGKITYKRLYCSKRKEIKACTAISIQYGFVEKAIYNHVLNFNWNKFLSQESSEDISDEIRKDLISKNNYAKNIRKIIDESEMPDLSIIRKLNDINNKIVSLESQLATIKIKPQEFDISGFDIENKEDRLRYNLALRKVVSTIKLTRHPFIDTFVSIEFHYHISSLKHLILMDSMNGDILSNIACSETEEALHYITNVMSITYDKRTHHVEIEGLYVSEDLALMLLFMEQQGVDKNLIEKTRKFL